MRHPHGLRAAAAARLPAIGAAYEGGFFAGAISHTANSVATHLLIVAPRATGATGTGYTLTTDKQWKTSNDTTSGTTSEYNGATNSANMNNASHPAAQFCEGLSIGGYSDWYLPARYELEIAYYNLKPTTASNDTSFGTNVYSVPSRGSAYTSGTPAQSIVTAFQTGNSEAFVADWHHSSTEGGVTVSWKLRLTDGVASNSTLTFNPLNALKTNTYPVRAFRKVAL